MAANRFGEPTDATATAYQLRFELDGDPPVTDIRVRIPVREGSLLMYPEGAEKFSMGWAHFVTQLAARDTAGRLITLRRTGQEYEILEVR